MSHTKQKEPEIFLKGKRREMNEVVIKDDTLMPR